MSTTAPPPANGTAHHTADTFRPLLKALALAASVDSQSGQMNHPTGTSTITHTQLEQILQHLADPNFTSSRENHAQIGSALTCLKFGRLDIQAETFALAARIFLECCLDVYVPELEADADEYADGVEYRGTLDLVGTGGDGKDTFNVSTTAAMVAAGVKGVRVCKHGAKASSSTSGSADLLMSLGIPLLALPASQLPAVLRKSKFAFLFAQLYHPALAPLGPIRRSLGFPTIFNVLGPLINPARPQRCILGVHSYYLGRIFAEALLKRGTQRAWIVCGQEGLDEISPAGKTDVWELDNGEIKEFTIEPEDFGLERHPLEHVGSHSANENAAIVLSMFSTPGDVPTEPLAANLPLDPAHFAHFAPETLVHVRSLPSIPKNVRLHAVKDYTLLQSAALLYVGSYASSLKEATQLARHSIESGAALRAMETFRDESNLAIARLEDEERKRANLKDRENRKSIEESVRNQDQYSYLPEIRQDVSVGTEE
ncbi:related to TRP4-anthranilate phosphoribosyltransferase [Sporisorium reilianum f. sp. reilianum]|uniref:Related to TRP4-anthranilate phosphoribosyltransferase n=1 Tax=Sporisorium reilianum f. sp. reilianum TaxID=72559 RepID=A0A2N8U667_9BASI|nr:related to TRP4-anthranilate phosphoribosyltransferase [Sporisorium reilianum f. sp. reilianum]